MPYGVQVQVLPCAPNMGSGNSSGNPAKEPAFRVKLTIPDRGSLHGSEQIQAVFGGSFRETAWKRPSPMNATLHVLQSMHRGRSAWIVDIPASFTEKREKKLFCSRGDADIRSLKSGPSRIHPTPFPMPQAAHHTSQGFGPPPGQAFERKASSKTDYFGLGGTIAKDFLRDSEKFFVADIQKRPTRCHGLRNGRRQRAWETLG